MGNIPLINMGLDSVLVHGGPELDLFQSLQDWDWVLSCCDALSQTCGTSYLNRGETIALSHPLEH